MSEMSCPWCEANLVLEATDDEQSCPECLTCWSYEDETTEELLIAA